MQLSFVDVRKAYFKALPQRSLAVLLPPELGLPKHLAGHLRRCMYGTSDAAQNWQQEAEKEAAGGKRPPTRKVEKKKRARRKNNKKSTK